MKRWLIVSVVLSLLLLSLLPACGRGGEKETPAPSVTMTPVPTPIPRATLITAATPTPTPTSAGPVKIGAIQAWSGPMAMAGILADQAIAVVEGQVKNMGGILGGREVKFVRGDDRGTVADAVGQARKMILDDKVCILTLGGETEAQFTAVSDVSEELKVPFVAFADVYHAEARKYSSSLMNHDTMLSRTANFVIDVLKPKTVAWLGYDSEDSHNHFNGLEGLPGAGDRWKAKGIDIIYEQYFPLDTQDFSPYLTKIKYLNPDVLVSYLNNEGQAISINKQIMDLGGWGSIKYFCADEPGSGQKAMNITSAVGTYTSVNWFPGTDEPGMKAFEDAFKQKYNRPPDANLSFYYNCFWIAIKAIELANTDDTGKVTQALRSGELEWDSAWGPLRIDTDGKGYPTCRVAQVQEGNKLVQVWSKSPY